MNDYQIPGAGPLYIFDDMMDTNMDFEMSQTTHLTTSQHLQNQQLRSIMYEQNPTKNHNQYPDQWPGTTMLHRQFAHQQHLSSLSSSSGVPSLRSSNNSIFSQGPTRDSISSSVSGWSHNSDYSRDQYISQAEYLLTRNSSAHSSYAPSPVECPNLPTPRKRITQRQATPEKDYFRTCVSGTKHSRPCSKEQKYFCTICSKLFVEKADWKRHEETYQERREMFQCDLCTAIYFLDKDFVTHHVQSHRCAACNKNTKCSEKRHVHSAKKRRMARTGWGCGFCCHFSTSWTERCNHIAHHLEKEGKTMENWYHSWVIYSLLQRPAVHFEWIKLLESKCRTFTDFAWNQHSTGRVEGYPEMNQNKQLQDELEYYTPDQDAAALARLAFDKAIKQVAQPESPIAPQVPPKDYPMQYDTLVQDLLEDTESWTQFIDSIVEDDIFPTDVCYLDKRHAR